MEQAMEYEHDFSRHRKDATSSRIVERMAEAGMSKKSMAKMLGISFDTFCKHYEEEIEQAKNNLELEMASEVIRRAREGNDGMLQFFMKSRFGWGQTTKIEHGGLEGSGLLTVPPIQINFVSKDQLQLGQNQMKTIENDKED